MKRFIKILNYSFLIFLLSVLIIGVLSFQKHISFEESSEKLNEKIHEYTKIANAFLKQNEIKSIFRRDLRRLPFGLPLSWFNNFDITYILSTSNSVFEIKIEDEFKDNEKEYLDNNFNAIKYNNKYLSNYILENKISRHFLDELIAFTLDNKVYKISKIMDNEIVLFDLERDEGLIYFQSLDSVRLSDLEYGNILSQINNNWFYIKEK